MLIRSYYSASLASEDKSCIPKYLESREPEKATWVGPIYTFLRQCLLRLLILEETQPAFFLLIFQQKVDFQALSSLDFQLPIPCFFWGAFAYNLPV